MLQSLLNSSQTLIFLSIAIASLLIVGASFLFGGDHGGGHHDFGHGHDGHGHGPDGEGTVSFLSPQIIFTFGLGFGSAGAVASSYGALLHWSILAGVGAGLLLALAAYAMFGFIYRQQATSVIETSNAIGRTAQVIVEIPSNGHGEVGLEVQGQYQTYLARTMQGGTVPKGARVIVIDNSAGQLIVENLSA